MFFNQPSRYLPKETKSKINGLVVFELKLTYLLHRMPFLFIFSKTKFWTDRNSKMAAQSFISVFPQRSLKFKILSATLYKFELMFKSWNFKNIGKYYFLLWILSMHKFQRVTNRLYINSFGLDPAYEWFARVYTSIQSKNNKIDSSNMFNKKILSNNASTTLFFSWV